MHWRELMRQSSVYSILSKRLGSSRKISKVPRTTWRPRSNKKKAESDLVGSEENARQFELELDDARDEVDRLE